MAPKSKPGSKRRLIKSTGAQRSSKKKREAEEADDQNEFFLEDEKRTDEAGAVEEEVETAEEKRLRLAKAYLQQLRAAERADRGGASDEEELPGPDPLGERLKQQALEAGGYYQRQIADTLVAPESEASTSGRRFFKCHRSSVTALALTSDDGTAYSVGKEGAIFRIDLESGTKSRFVLPKSASTAKAAVTGPEWVKPAARMVARNALLAAAVSSDGNLLAVGGGDSSIHVFDTRSGQYLQAFGGHKDAVTGLAFREGTHELFSGSADRSIKLWSLDDRAYVDTLFGHQAEVLGLDVLRAERVVSAGHDHTCRVWKVPEETQLIFRAHAMALDCCRYVTGTEWITGSSDGSLALWSQMKKKPMSILRDAHPLGSVGEASTAAPHDATAATWVQSVAVCRGSDLAASGAGNGYINLWGVQSGKGGGKSHLDPLGQISARGFINGLQIARSGRFVLAGIGQEPRLGRWSRDAKAHPGLLLHPLTYTS